jgi:hypothetical protein
MKGIYATMFFLKSIGNVAEAEQRWVGVGQTREILQAATWRLS